MSDAGKFGSSNEKEPQRLDHLEAQLPLLARLSEQLALKNQLEDQYKSLGKVKDDVALNNNHVEALNVAVNKYYRDSQTSLKLLSEALDGAKRHIQSLEESLNEKDVLLNRFETSMDAVKSILSCVGDKLAGFASKDAVEALVRADAEKHSYVCAELKSLKDSIEEKAKFANKIDNSLGVYKLTCENSNNQVANQVKQLSSLIASSKEELQKSNKQQSALVSDLKEELVKKFASLPSPLPSLKMEDVRSEIQKLLEPVSLDAKNSVLRSNNASLQVSLLEKKVEQVSLLAKRFELQS